MDTQLGVAIDIADTQLGVVIDIVNTPQVAI